MVTMCDEDGVMTVVQFPVDPYTREVSYDHQAVHAIYENLMSYDTWVFHNALFDLEALYLLFYENDVAGFDYEVNNKTIHDTMLMAHCHNNLDRLGLKGLALQYVGFPETDEKLLKDAVTRARRYGRKLGYAIAEPSHPHLTPLKKDKGNCDYWLPAALIRNNEELDPEDKKLFANVCANYALGDVERTMALFLFFFDVLCKREDFHHYKRNSDCIIPLWGMQAQGLNVLEDNLPEIVSSLSREMSSLREGMMLVAGEKDLNPRSGDQVRYVLYDKMGIPPQAFTKAGAASTDKDALNDLLEEPLTARQETFIKRLLTYRKLNTACSYLESYQRYQVDGYLFSSINPTGTSTTRCSSHNPNAQNISKQENDEDSMTLGVSINLRGAFGPPDNTFWVAIDYAQLQLRIFAHACEDEYLLNAFEEGLDIHDTVARKVFQTDEPSGLQRRAAKAINFGIIFGAGKRKIERMSGVEGSYDEFKRQFPLVDRYLRLTEKQAKKMGYIRTLGGYPLRVPRATAYKACNYIVQGTEGELVKKAIVDTTNYCWDEAKGKKHFVPVMTIHDEIIFQSTDTDSPKAKHFKEIQDICALMNKAASYYGVDTEVDAKIITDEWSSSEPLAVAE
jgi:DNA polymerase I-like protein with 3'-5' exonuclease and polymerase domains